MPLWMVLPAFLAVLALMCWRGGLRCQTFAAAVLLLDWAACTMLTLAPATGLTWTAMAIVDFGAALGLLVLPRNRRGFLVIAALLAAQIIAHAGFSITGDTEETAWSYYWTLFTLAWAQALACAAWAGHDAIRMARRDTAADRRALAADAVRDPLDVRGGRR